jgi:hypothetical protein
MDFRTVAGEAEKVVEAIAKVEGPIMAGIGMFVPGASPITSILGHILPLVIPDIEKALSDIAAGNDGDIFDTLVEFVNHIRQGKPNSAALTPGEPSLPETS